jgi:hypothetical protein
MSTDDELIERFVISFGKFDELSEFKHLSPIAWQLRTGDADESGWFHWKPAKFNSDQALLEGIYARLPSRFPPLYERLVLSYRWADVEVHSCMLLANPPGPDLHGLLDQISQAPGLWNALLPSGYIQFGRARGGQYDPVCFDIKSRKKSRDCRIVRIDHEQILCNNRVKVIAEVAPSFEQLVRDTISQPRRT